MPHLQSFREFIPIMLQAAVFLDKDGTLLEDVSYNVDPSLMRFTKGARKALWLLAALPYPLFVISNQAGVALGHFEHDALQAVETQLHRMFGECGAKLNGVYWCPHHPQGTVSRYAIECGCRKPSPGMLLRAAREHQLDLPRSWFVGDILDDAEAGNRAGCHTVLLDNGHETQWRKGGSRTPDALASDLLEAAHLVLQRSNAQLRLAAENRGSVR
ncbi:MAG: D-glycero-beta-D-manno-heptose-1,7-bisphosphate 7-phosphatase (EC [uncultured Paraburkholderia sp.]|nr:MAG: D-glycero-beta-D-manno-heptose-1,7-bisphosphate 7-phosphatase (EC [uncultured Paraburkholderia sp.]CAH2938639.1 MAG: D-glycero-beta-D-manno-heptose-1,7-bisphosphate 7-phosphatase (EC [uncultured Paraburkholderia sp.]